MQPVELKPDVYWVGAIDWNLREFHGYHTPRGTTYNAYLIIDRDTTLIDTVKAPFYPELIDRISKITDPATIKYVISNHVEMDHTGALPHLLKLLPNATVITSTQGHKGLTAHYHPNWKMKPVNNDETLPIGKRTLHFHHIPMVHWPDSMVTYSPHDNLLLPNDAFGQHIASAHRFDNDIGWDILHEEAARYYANIVLPYSDQVATALSALSTLKFDMIGPSHGQIWRTYLPQILQHYQRWATHQSHPQAVIVYDSMWGSTNRMAGALRDGLEATGTPVTMHNLKTSHISDVITTILHSQLVCIGSPTLNTGVLPSVGAFLTYLKGLRPKHRIGFAFGSYGWGGQSISDIEAVIKTLAWDMPEDSIKTQWIPDENTLKTIRDTGQRLGNYIKDKKNVHQGQVNTEVSKTAL
jgi:flavorubredoxin